METPLEVAEGLQKSNVKEVAFLAESYIKLYKRYQELEDTASSLTAQLMEMEELMYCYEFPDYSNETN